MSSVTEPALNGNLTEMPLAEAFAATESIGSRAPELAISDVAIQRDDATPIAVTVCDKTVQSGQTPDAARSIEQTDADPCVELDAQAGSTIAKADLDNRRFTRLCWLSYAGIFPWCLIAFVSIMAFGSPNAIITPLMWSIFITIWSFPLVACAGRLASWWLRKRARLRAANLVMGIPASISAFQFALLLAPLAIAPLLSDGYFALMASCLASMVVASWCVSWAFK